MEEVTPVHKTKQKDAQPVRISLEEEKHYHSGEREQIKNIK